MAKELNYYDDEFNKIKNLKGASIKITGWDSSTKELNINLDSIEALERFIKRAKKDLVKRTILANNEKLKANQYVIFKSKQY